MKTPTERATRVRKAARDVAKAVQREQRARRNGLWTWVVDPGWRRPMSRMRRIQQRMARVRLAGLPDHWDDESLDLPVLRIPPGLTSRERDVLVRIAVGQSSTQIGRAHV